MSESPFIYGKTVSDRHFTDREEEAERLEKNLSNGINTTIISPRRWGKSSLVEKVLKSTSRTQKKIKVIQLDLFMVSCEEEFLELLARETIKASSGKFQDWMKTGKEFFTRLVPKFSYGLDPNSDFSLSFDWKDLKKNSEEILQLPERIARKKGIKFIIALDEFQNMTSFSDYKTIEKKWRAAWQKQKLVTYCLYGSKRHMMNEIFNHPSKPFYRFGDIIHLKKIPIEKWVPYLQKGFESTNKILPENYAVKICVLMKNHSWYVQQLAHYVWGRTHKKVSEKELISALNEVLETNAPLYQREIETMNNSQINLLKAICAGESKFTSAEVMSKYNLGSPNNVTKSKQSLIKNEILDDEEGKLVLLDPAFELWLNRNLNK
ncbi:MAG: ATP-binding protein [Flavobacteriales bacterium]|nr:ATP-binding protein [Flavobacteriales bacterium]